MKKMLFVYNPMAGKEQISTHLSNIVQVFCKASFEVTIFATAGPKDATRIVEERGTEYDYCVFRWRWYDERSRNRADVFRAKTGLWVHSGRNCK